MAANRKIRREMNLDEFEDQALEALGSVPGLALTMRNGEVVTIPHPMLVSDDQEKLINRVRNREDLDRDDEGAIKQPETINGEPADGFSVRFAKAILGEADHARFLAGGGSSNKVSLAWQYLTENLQVPKAPK